MHFIAKAVFSGVHDAMPRNRWRKSLKVAGLTALASAAIVLFSVLTSHSEALENEATYRSDIHRENADYRIVWICKSASSQQSCIDETRQAARENEREEQDLAAQKITAWWTKIMGLAALIGMGLSALGVWLVKTTFDETRLANVMAGQTHEMEFRPILTFDRLHVERFGSVDLMITPVWKNIGKFPAQPTMTKTYRKYDGGNARAARIEEILAGGTTRFSENGQIVPPDSEHFGPSVLIQAIRIGRRENPPTAGIQWLKGFPENVATCIFSVEYTAALNQLPGKGWHSQSVRGVSPYFEGETNVLSGEFGDAGPPDYPRDIMT